MTQRRVAWILVALTVLAPLGCGQNNGGQPGPGEMPPTSAGGSGGGSGNRAGSGGSAGPGGNAGVGGGAGGGAATGGSGAGGTGGATGADASNPDSLGLDAVASAPAPRPCIGMPGNGSGGGLTALRTDVSARRVMGTPGNGIRLARDGKTGELLLLLQNGNVQRIELQPGGGATSMALYSSGQIGMPAGSNAFGMSLGPDGTLYVVSHLSQAVSGNSSRASVWKGVRGASGARAWSRLVETDSYPRSRTQYDHEWSGIVADPEGRFVYVNAGSRTDHGESQTNGGTFPAGREVALTAGIFRFPTTANSMLLPNNAAQLRSMGVLFASGTRNSFDLEFAPNGDLFGGDNGPDADYHEELNWIREGRHYGFPWRLGNEDNQMQFPNYAPDADRRLQRGVGFLAIDSGGWRNDPGFAPRPEGVTFTDPIPNVGPDANQYRNPQSGAVEKASVTNRPYATFTDHSSPLGLVFDRNEGALCGEFAGGLFLLRYGKAAGQAFEAGRDLLHLKLSNNGTEYTSAATTQLVRGFTAPVDAVLAGDRLYVLDRTLDGAGQGALWEVTLPNGK